MTDKQFQDVLHDRLDAIQEVLANKAKEYSRGDRLHNFKRAGEAMRQTPERALMGMLMKHLVSLFDMVDDIDAKTQPWTTAAWEEKIGDSINYLILLEALVKERR